MSVIFMEGFDLYSSTVSATGWSDGGTTTPYGVGRSGFVTTNGSCPVSLPSTYTDLTIGFALYHGNATGRNDGGLIRFKNFTSAIVSVYTNSDGSISANLGSSTGTSNRLCISAGSVVATNVWCYVEVSLHRNSSGGSITISVDGVTVASASGVNTGASDIDNLTLGISSNYSFRVDDLYVVDSLTPLGGARIDTILPSSDDSVQFTPNSGANNYSRVADSSGSDGDTSYVSDATAGHKDRYGMADLSTTPTSIYAVKATFISRKDDATTRTARTNVVSGASTDTGPTIGVPSSYAGYDGNVLNTDPNTSSAWTKAGVDALKQEIEIVS